MDTAVYGVKRDLLYGVKRDLLYGVKLMDTAVYKLKNRLFTFAYLGICNKNKNTTHEPRDSRRPTATPACSTYI
jgi:hypothetical protein